MSKLAHVIQASNEWNNFELIYVMFDALVSM
jgi:hypothetical protein